MPGALVVVGFGRFPVFVLWVLRVCLGRWWVLFVSPSVVLCVFLVCFCVASDWLVSSWQRPPLVLPAPSVGPLGRSGPVSFLLVPPSGYLVVSCDGPVVMPGGVECSNV